MLLISRKLLKLLNLECRVGTLGKEGPGQTGHGEHGGLVAQEGQDGVVHLFEAGSYLRLIDSCITQLKAQGPSRTCNQRPSRTCNESKEEEEEVLTCSVRTIWFESPENGIVCPTSRVVNCFGFGVQGSGFRVHGSGFGV